MSVLRMGDDMTARPPAHMTHRILATRMRRDDAEWWTLCTCGLRIEAGSSLELADRYSQHRLANGQARRSSKGRGEHQWAGKWSMKETIG